MPNIRHNLLIEPFNVNKIYATEMYDYAGDPLEKVNVVNEKKYKTVSANMHSKMLAFFKYSLKQG